MLILRSSISEDGIIRNVREYFRGAAKFVGTVVKAHTHPAPEDARLMVSASNATHRGTLHLGLDEAAALYALLSHSPEAADIRARAAEICHG